MPSRQFEYTRASELRQLIPDPLREIVIVSGHQSEVIKDFEHPFRPAQKGRLLRYRRVRLKSASEVAAAIRGIEYADGRIAVVIRGGGSGEDLAVFDDDAVVEAIAASDVPVFTAIGHNANQTASDAAATGSAQTPGTLGQMLSEAQFKQYQKQRSRPQPHHVAKQPPQHANAVAPLPIASLSRLPPPNYPPYAAYANVNGYANTNRSPRRGLGTASLTLGCVSLVFSGFGVLPLIGLILGIAATGARPRGRAVAGIIINSAVLIMNICFVFLFLLSLSASPANNY